MSPTSWRRGRATCSCRSRRAEAAREALAWDGPPRAGARRGRLAGGFGGDRLDLLGGALELGVGEHGGALEGQFALELEPGARAPYSSLTLTVTGRGMR